MLTFVTMLGLPAELGLFVVHPLCEESNSCCAKRPLLLLLVGSSGWSYGFFRFDVSPLSFKEKGLRGTCKLQKVTHTFRFVSYLLFGSLLKKNQALFG